VHIYQDNMADQVLQPTILVKKADGTTERITLDELKKRQAAKSVPEIKKEIIQAVKITPVLRTEKKLEIKPTAVPVALPVLQKTDVKPLLDEEVPESKHAQTVTSPARGDQIDNIINNLSFKILPTYQNRLRSSIQLRLKDVRSEADTRALCLRSIKDGGLGLTETQAEELLKHAKPMASLIMEKTLSSKPVQTKEAIVEKIIGQSVTTPNIANLISTPNRQNISQSNKLIMHDVKTKPLNIGPLEEIQFFSLVDLRRLSANPSQSVSRLKQKFLNLKEESILLFMDAVGAWHNSPLFQNYFLAVDEALVQKRRLETVLGEKDKISFAEIQEIIKMEKELDI